MESTNRPGRDVCAVLCTHEAVKAVCYGLQRLHYSRMVSVGLL